MLSKSENTKRIAKNTIFLYGRTIFTMLITLYTSRIVLKALGIEDYGIYNVVGGFVTMFALISGSLTTATQRFITFELGKKDNSKSREIFSAALIAHFAIGIGMLILFETLGIWFLNAKLNISQERIIAANWVFQASIVSFLINLVSIPYSASIIANEKMKVFAYIGVFEAIMKLLIVYFLLLLNKDPLITYSLMILGLSITIAFIYRVYCKRNFSDCEFIIVKDRSAFKKIFRFAGWSFFGASSAILMRQGVNVLLNIFFGVAINAARGIAVQVETAITNFVTNFMMALNPQITKSYASNDKDYTFSLVNQGARFSFYLYLVFSLPIFIEAPLILKLWLGIVPDYTVVFLRMSLVNTMVSLMSNTMVTLMLASGNIKKYQILVGGTGLLVLPLSYIFLKLGFSPTITYVVNFVVYVIQLAVRLILLKDMVNLNIAKFLYQVVLNILLVLGISLVLPLLLNFCLTKSYFSTAVVIAGCLLSTILTVFLVGLRQNERKKILRIIKDKISHVYVFKY